MSADFYTEEKMVNVQPCRTRRTCRGGEVKVKVRVRVKVKNGSRVEVKMF